MGGNANSAENPRSREHMQSLSSKWISEKGSVIVPVAGSKRNGRILQNLEVSGRSVGARLEVERLSGSLCGSVCLDGRIMRIDSIMG